MSAKRCSDANLLLDKAEETGVLSNDEFAALMRSFLVSENGYVLDTGTNAQVNAEIALRLEKNIKERKRLWRKFMVA